MPDSFLPPHAHTLTVGALSGPVVVPADNLVDLRFLSEIKSFDDLRRLSDGPYLVGRIVDQGAFNAPIIHPHMICSTQEDIGLGAPHMVAGQKVWSYENAPTFLSHRWNPQSEGEFPNPKHRSLIRDILQIDTTLGFQQAFIHLSYDQTPALPGKAQRTPVWHRDGGETSQRAYLVSSTHSTFYLREAVARAVGDWTAKYNFNHDNIFSEWRKNYCDMENQASASHMLVESAPYDIYLMRPEYTWHRGQIMPQGGSRTFLRVVCG